MEKKIMYLFARTPVHVGAGSSVGAVDSPVQRERHTRIPIIPGSSLKGVISDLWNEKNSEGKLVRSDDGKILFGNDSSDDAKAGNLLIGEARVLAFPVRSAKGAFAWISCPLALRRFKRDAGLSFDVPKVDKDDQCFAMPHLMVDNKVVLEEYCFSASGDSKPVAAELKKVFEQDPVWQEVEKRLVVVSDEIFSYFAEHACEIVTRIRVNDETGTVDKGALFNQEQVPSETMFYSVIAQQKDLGSLDKLAAKISEAGVIQVGGDETIGLGYCSVNLV